MKYLLLLIAFVGLACTASNVAATATKIVAPATSVQLPGTATNPVVTASPTATNIPVPTPTLIPVPAMITVDNVANLDKFKSFDVQSLRKVVFSPDGKVVAAATGNMANFGVTTWSVPDGKPIINYPFYSGIVWDIAYSPDGKWIATAANDIGPTRLRILDASQPKQVVVMGGPRITASVAFSWDGKLLAVGGVNDNSQGTIWVYDTSNWKRIFILVVPGQNVLGLVFTKDGRLISSGTDGRIRVWSLPDRLPVRVMFRGPEANRMALSPDGSLLATLFCSDSGTSGCKKGGVVIWRTGDWGVVNQFTDVAEGMAFSPDGSMLMTGSGTNDPLIRIRRVSDWMVVVSLESQAYAVDWSSDSKLLASITFTNLNLWAIK